MIKIFHLTKRFANRLVLDDINLELPSKGFVVLHGSSGSGKSTLLNILGGILRDYEGFVEIKNTCISRLNEEEMRSFRIYNIGYVFQNFNLLNLETVYENIALPLDSISTLNKKIKRRRIVDVMQSLDIAHLEKKNINKLSGGEKQRVSIARSIINSPSILLCDEPTGALDNKNSKNVYEILKKLSTSMLVIVASHDNSIVSYADILVGISDGKINQINQKEIINKKDDVLLIANTFKKKKSELSNRFLFHHAYQKMKSKKFRSLITNTILSMSLTGIGVSLLLSSSMSGKIKGAFNSLTNGNQIVATLKQNSSNTFSGVYSAPESHVEELSLRYKKYVEGYGVNYLVNYEDFFKDKNNFYFAIRGDKYYLESLSARSINDFCWNSDDDNSITYPYSIADLDYDEVILALNYVDLVNLCYKLQIRRSYSSLGSYLRGHDLLLYLEVQNSAWQYEDEQIFIVKGVKESAFSCIYHTDSLWNKKVFEKMMLLPTRDDDNYLYPWQMYKIYYLKCLEDPGDFIDRTLSDELSYDYVFERTSYYYNPSICKINEVCQEKRINIYLTDKVAINTGVINSLASLDSRLSHYYFTSSFGYSSYASNLLNGFSKNFYVSFSENKIDEAIDADTMNKDETLEVSLPPGVSNGNFLNSLGNGLHFSSKVKSLKKGRLPNRLNEIAISSGLEEQLLEDGYGKELYLAGVADESLDEDGKIEKTYQKSKLVVVGIVNEDKPYLYHSNYWTLSFFRDNFGISMFNLTPTSVIFELDDDVSAKEVCEKYNGMFKDLVFSSPSDELTKSIESTLSYANIILLAFSLIAMIISMLLLGTIIMLNVIESENEIVLFTYLGISQKDINSTFVSQALLHSLIAVALANIEIIFIDIFISYSLFDMLQSSFIYSFNPLPLLITSIIGILMSIALSNIVTNILIKKKKKNS